MSEKSLTKGVPVITLPLLFDRSFGEAECDQADRDITQVLIVQPLQYCILNYPSSTVVRYDSDPSKLSGGISKINILGNLPTEIVFKSSKS
jgi:hypothetical protein